MKLRELPFGIKIAGGFTIILLLFTLGIGINILSMSNVISRIEMSNKANHLLQEMFFAREKEKEYFISKSEKYAQKLNENIHNASQLIKQIESNTINKAFLSKFKKTDQLIYSYQQDFNQLVSNDQKIAPLQDKMKKSSSAILETINKKIEDTISEKMNMALVTGKGVSPVYEEIYKETGKVKIKLMEAILHENAFLMYNDAAQVSYFNEKLKECQPIIKDVAYLISTSNDDTLKEAFQQIETGFKDYAIETLGEIYKLWENNNTISRDMLQKGTEVIKEVEEFQQHAEKEMFKTKNMAFKITFSLLIAGIIIGTILALFITKSLMKAIRLIVEELIKGSEYITKASAQVSSGSNFLAEGAVQQAASIEETSASIKEMTSMATNNADNAGQVNNHMTEASKIIEEANIAMSQLIDSMQKIRNASEKTSLVIKNIDGIAFQTNLLALNAAVEAARAGESGLSFAVVADEVRNLALRSAEAAKNTQNMIEETVKKINEGSTLVKDANEAFSKVITSSAKMAALVDEITQASQNQVNRIAQISNTMFEMDKRTQETAHHAVDFADAAKQMNAQSDQMRKNVRHLEALMKGRGFELVTAESCNFSHSHMQNQSPLLLSKPLKQKPEYQ